MEEFTQHKYARMWRLRRTSGKSYLFRNCSIRFCENDGSPDEKMCINCSEKDRENREAEHAKEREKEHEGEETGKEEEERIEDEEEDRDENLDDYR